MYNSLSKATDDGYNSMLGVTKLEKIHVGFKILYGVTRKFG